MGKELCQEQEINMLKKRHDKGVVQIETGFNKK